MPPSRWRRILAALVASTILLGAKRTHAEPGDGLDFFETRVRPVLVEHCVGCHGPKKQEAGLRFDSRARAMAGGDNGPVILSERPERSLLVAAIQHDGEIRMPPKGKLPERTIADLVEWVRIGAPWPEEKDTAIDPTRAARNHWAFQRVRPVAPPATPEVANAIDAFVRERLGRAGLAPSPPADRATLIRRLVYDLTGLPPSPEEVAAFVADKSPDAWERVVDHYLASPRLGERWGRHWLDVARYADTRGYVRLKDNPDYPTAWTYRDYVVEAMNADLPYDVFVVQQLAADRLDAEADPRSLAALGFLTLGQRFINSRHDIIDDRIDVVARGLLGLGVACARCHDHKFDPIPTRDYYSLHGVFLATLEPRVPPTILRAEDRPRYAAYFAELDERQARLDAFLAEQRAKLEVSFRERAVEYLLAAHRESVQANYLSTMFLIDAAKDLNPAAIQRWGRWLERSRKTDEPVFRPWRELVALPADSWSDRAKQTIEGWPTDESRDRIVVERLKAKPPASIDHLAKTYGELLNEAWRRIEANDADRAWSPLTTTYDGPDSPLRAPLEELEDFLFVDASLQNQLHDRQRLVDDWIASPGAAPHASAVFDAASVPPARVFRRGNASDPGDEVPRRFLDVLSAEDRPSFVDGSGRLELARAIASPDNPLTARVIVNRVWAHHFGAGLVATASDFGVRGEAPSHPEALDWLATRFVADGWSLKRLHRLIVTSDTYRQASDDRPDAAAIDPENRLLARMNRRRLEWEALHDSLLAAGGNLDLAMGGPARPLAGEPPFQRRALYAKVDRLNPAAAPRTFDFVSPDTSAPTRHRTTIPQQALFFLNSPFLRRQSRALATRLDLPTRAEAGARVAAMWRTLYSREATAEEIDLALRHVADAPANGFDAWDELAQTLLMANEFLFVD